jgi:formylglycine-generating enzyme required for sulfatase activity
LRLLRLLEKESARFLRKGEFKNLMYLLAPAVARSPREQQRFYALFEAFWNDCAREWEEIPDEVPETAPPAEPTSPEPAEPTRYAIPWIQALPLLLLVIWQILMRAPVLDFQIAPADHWRAGVDTLFAESACRYVDTARLVWEVVDDRTGAVEYTAAGARLQWPIPADAGDYKSVALRLPDSETAPRAVRKGVLITCSDPPTAGRIKAPEGTLSAGESYTFRIENPAPGCLVRWLVDGRDTLAGPALTHAFRSAGQYAVQADVFREGKSDWCSTRRSVVVQVDADKPYLPLQPLRADEPRAQYFLQSWIWLLCLLPLLPALWFFLRWLRKRREKPAERSRAELESKYPILDAKPYYIPYRPQEHKITIPRDFFRIAEVLHRREESLRRHFDVPASVKATIEKAGFPELKERALAQPAEYLVLLERRNARDQQGRLFERLARFLEKRDVPARFFEHDGQFDRFRNADFPEGITLSELRRRFPTYRLVLVGGAHALSAVPEESGARLRTDAAAELLRYPRRLLLTPEPPVAWSYQEKLLHRHFLLFPADTEGLLAGFDLLDRTEEYEPPAYDKWRAGLRDRRTDLNPRYNAWETPQDHRLYLLDDDDAWRWLCALSVCVQPDWALTLAIGRAIGVEVTHDRLLRLTRIPWLSANRPDDALRLQFLRILSETDPDAERAARTAVAEELEAVREQTAQGFAETERRTDLALQYFALDPRDETHKQTLRELRALGLLGGSRRAELDWVVANKISPAELPPDVSPDLDGWLSVPAPRRFFSPALIIALACLALSLLAGGALAWLRAQAAPPAAAAPLYRAERADDPAVALNNRAVLAYAEVAAQPDYSSWQNRRDSAQLADSLLLQAAALRQPAGYPLADSNRIALQFNQAAIGLNFYLSGAMDAAFTGNAQADALRRTALALYYFQFKEIVGDTATLAAAADARRLNALHGQGLAAFYGGDTLSARAQYRQMLGAQPTYFDTLSMSVNLQTLLAAVGAVEQPQYSLRGIVLDADTRRPIVGATVQPKSLPTLRTDADGRFFYAFQTPPATDRIWTTVSAANYITESLPLLRHSVATLLDTVRLRPIATVTEPSPATATPNPSPPIIPSAVPRPDMVQIPGGTFMMGDAFGEGGDNEKPHKVTLSGFRMARYKLTFEEYDQYCNSTGASRPDDQNWGRGRHPVINISWYDAVAYCNWLSAQHGYTPAYIIDKNKRDPDNQYDWIVRLAPRADGYRLPTEAEWEYAARAGGKKVRFGNGKNRADPKEINFNGSADYKQDYSVVGEYRKRTVPAGSLRSPNALGLHDMSGNVWEWCWDWYGDYPDELQIDPRGAEEGDGRVLRGGGWLSFPQYCRVAFRNSNRPDSRNYSIGFRLVRPF